MNIDRILETLHQHNVDYLLIGGVCFLLRHKPVLTYDVDIWIADHDENHGKINAAIIQLGGEWGPTEGEWTSVPQNPSWLKLQTCFCLTTEFGALDVFREVLGLEGLYDECKKEAVFSKTISEIPYHGLSDRHMLLCQLALDKTHQNQDRIETLQRVIESSHKSSYSNRGD